MEINIEKKANIGNEIRHVYFFIFLLPFMLSYLFEDCISGLEGE